MSRTLLPLIFCFFGLAALTPTTADTTSCIVFENYFSPYHTYAVVLETEDNGECCELCARDDKCVAWTREEESGRCSLKDDADVLVGSVGVDSGIKYEGDAAPELVSNGVGASVIIGKEETPQPASTSVSAVAVATSNGGSSTAHVVASPDGVATRSSVSGSGSAYTAADTPTVSLATSLTKESGETPEYVVTYYEKPSVVGEVSTIAGKTIPLVIPEEDDPLCYRCIGFPCIFTEGLSYRDGVAIVDTHTDDIEGCCKACRSNADCISWWRNPETSRCVLNGDLPDQIESEVVYGGTVL